MTLAAPISLMPHAVCWASAPRLIWTMVVTNLITFLSYVTICSTLLFLVGRTRRVIARDWAFFVTGFAMFIVACGSTHLFEVITTWIPVFWADATANIVTAILSALVAILLIRRASVIAFSINDYAARLANTEDEKLRMHDSLLASRKLADWSRMSASVAHEINNPIESIQNALHLIRTTPGASQEVIELAETAADEAARVATISRSTLSFFRSGGTPEPVDLTVAAEAVKALLDRSLLERHVAVDIEASGETTVEAFAGETRQVLLNLVRNACEATVRPGTHITIQIHGHASGVEVVVADQGSGIDPAILPSLFDFGHSTKGDQGNGIGLWAVKHILARHRGSIQVESGVGKGTRFTLFWPRSFHPAEVSAGAALPLIARESSRSSQAMS